MINAARATVSLLLVVLVLVPRSERACSATSSAEETITVSCPGDTSVYSSTISISSSEAPPQIHVNIIEVTSENCDEVLVLHPTLGGYYSSKTCEKVTAKAVEIGDGCFNVTVIVNNVSLEMDGRAIRILNKEGREVIRLVIKIDAECGNGTVTPLGMEINTTSSTIRDMEPTTDAMTSSLLLPSVLYNSSSENATSAHTNLIIAAVVPGVTVILALAVTSISILLIVVCIKKRRRYEVTEYESEHTKEVKTEAGIDGSEQTPSSKADIAMSFSRKSLPTQFFERSAERKVSVSTSTNNNEPLPVLQDTQSPQLETKYPIPPHASYPQVDCGNESKVVFTQPTICNNGKHFVYNYVTENRNCCGGILTG